MTHPIVLAAKAAYGELTNEEAKAFFKATALSHTLLVAFYALEAVYWTVEAGRITRRFLDSFNPPPASEAVTIAGLLCPAQDEPPITTEAVVTNQQKLEQHIINTIKGIYDNVESNQESDEVGSQSSGQATVGVGQEPIPDQTDTHQKTTKAVSTRTRKPRAASGDKQQAKDPAPKSRVPRSRGAVSQK
jgi:hypothetical protein